MCMGRSFSWVWGRAGVRIARLNSGGSLDNSFDPGFGVDDTVYALTLQPDAKILVGGAFHTVGAQNRNGIVRLNSNGTVDQGFDPGDGVNDTVYTISLQPDATIILGGVFTSYNQTRHV